MGGRLAFLRHRLTCEKIPPSVARAGNLKNNLAITSLLRIAISLVYVIDNCVKGTSRVVQKFIFAHFGGGGRAQTV